MELYGFLNMDRIKQEIYQLFIRNVRHAFPIALPFFVLFTFDSKALATFTLAMLLIQMVQRLLFIPIKEPFLVGSRNDLGKFDNEKIKEFSTVLIITGIIGILGSIFILYVLEHFINIFIQTKDLLFPISIAIIGLGFRTIYEILLIAVVNRKVADIYVFVATVFSVFVLGIFYFLNLINIPAIFLVFGLVPILTFIFFYPVSILKIIFPMKFRQDVFNIFFQQLHWIIVGSMAVFFIKWIDIIAIRYFGSLNEVGVYNLAYQIFILLSLIALQIPGFIVDTFSLDVKNKEMREKYFSIYRKYVLPFWMLTVLTVASLSVYASSIFNEPASTSVIFVVFIFLLAASFYLLTYMYLPMLRREGEFIVIHKAFILGLATNIILDVILVPTMGMFGASIATLITFIVAWAFVVFSYKRIMRRI